MNGGVANSLVGTQELPENISDAMKIVLGNYYCTRRRSAGNAQNGKPGRHLPNHTLEEAELKDMFPEIREGKPLAELVIACGDNNLVPTATKQPNANHKKLKGTSICVHGIYASACSNKMCTLT